MEELCYLPARVLADRLRRREVTAAEALAAHVERIGKHNPSLNAVVSADFDQAREAAAAAAGLTPVEVGSDLAGSLRLPPHFCGVYGLKATEHRSPTTGFFRPPQGSPRSVRILGSLGPMARDLADLDLVLRVIAGPDRQ